MRDIEFITTFSKNGYYVYGESWIKSFLNKTEKYKNITAKIYINEMNISEFKNNDKLKIVDFDLEIPEHKKWVSYYSEKSNHTNWNKKQGFKFSFKSFVMMNALEKNNKKIVVWLDADCIFVGDDFDTFVEDVLQNKFIACQKEKCSEHVESGVVIFDTSHKDKNIFLNHMKNFYMNEEEFNSFGQFFDGYVIYRSLSKSKVSFVDLNEGFGIEGVQSDPNCTFLNPLIKKRFFHNIGHTGKQKYKNWEKYKNDPLLSAVFSTKSREELRKEAIEKIKIQIKKIKTKE
jgi:hypothetical protein